MTTRPGRSADLDLFKTMLVVGMVAAHVLQLLSRSMPLWTERFSEVINLVTFSGFMLAIGIGLGLSGGRSRPLWSRLRPVLLLLAAAYISAFAFVMLVDRQVMTTGLALDILTMRRLFGWSEFLATFFVLYALVAVARPAIVAVAIQPVLLITVSALCFATTWLVMDQGWPLTATLIGTTRFASFPLLPYLPLFLVGVSIGRAGGRLTLWHWTIAFAASGWLVWGLVQTGQWPQRFPPSIQWVVGSAALLLVYLELAKAIATRFTVPGWVTVPGRHVLSFLLLTNLSIFLARNLLGKPVNSLPLWLATTAVLLLVIGLGWLLLETRRRVGTSAIA